MLKKGPFQPGAKNTRVKRRERKMNSAQPSLENLNDKNQGQKGLVNNKRRSLRAGLAVIGGRAAGALSRRLHIGGGTSIVGVVAQRLYPNIIEHLATQLTYGSVVITGTNG